MTLTRRRALPEVVSGYELGGYFSVIVPIERTNLVTNPSFETATTGYTVFDGATIVRTTEEQRRGVLSAKVKPGLASTSGLYYTTSALTAGTPYSFSLDAFIRGGQKYTIYVYDGVRVVAQNKFVGIGAWARVSLVFTAVTTGAHRLYLAKDYHASTNEFFTDGWQLEECEDGSVFPTTYIDGDQQGLVDQVPAAYLWNGTEHASTSTRSGQTRAGGQIVNLKDLGFRLLAIVGLGMGPITNVSTPMGLLGGAVYERTVLTPRKFTLVGAMNGDSFVRLNQMRRDIEAALRPDSISIDQPLVLRYQFTNDCGDPNGQELDIVCTYDSGLEGNADNLNQERLGLQFTVLENGLSEDGYHGADLSFASDINVSSTVGVFKRDKNGAWSSLNATGSVDIQGFAVSPVDNSLYATQPILRVSRWNGATWDTIGLANSTINALAFGPDGTLYVGGSFTTINGVSASRIAKWDGTSWTALGSGGLNNNVLALAVGSDGSLYAGGSFTQMGGVANTSRIAKWDGSSWTALGTGVLDQSVRAISVDAADNVYVTGAFTQVGGISNTGGIAYWDGSAWNAMGTGMAGTPGVTGNEIVVSRSGIIYLTGTFTSIGGITVDNFAQWNGVSWASMGNVTFGGGTPFYASEDIDGTLIVSGAFTDVNGVTLPDRMARWNGTSWEYIDIDLPGTPAVYPTIVDQLGNIYIAFNSASIGTALVSFSNIIENDGDAKASTIIKLYGPGKLYQIANYTTKKKIFFNLTLVAGEIAYLTIAPGRTRFYSNVRQNLLGTILPSSQLASFALMPGENIISVLMVNTTSASKVYMMWRNRYHSIAGGNRR